MAAIPEGIRTRFGRIDVVLLVAMVVGFAVRVWSFGDIPPGLNQDEASTAYDAFSLIHHGVDRHGYRLPVMLVSWGSGMYALASYLEAPFIGLLGLEVWVARLPFLLMGMAALPLFFVLLRDTLDRRTARLGVALLALSPWHIMVSRWGLDCTVFPFVFLVATVLLQRSLQRPRLLVVAGLVYGLSLYAYGTAYVAVPVFAVFVLVHGIRHRRWPIKTVVLSAAAFGVAAVPIALYLAINKFGWDAIRTPLFSVPRLTGVPRYNTVANLHLTGDFVRAAWTNLLAAIDLFRSQDDGALWNNIPGFGMLYFFSPFLALAGLALLLAKGLRAGPQRAFVMLAWSLAGMVLALFVPANINRMNIAMFPFVCCVAIAMAFLWTQRALAILLCLLVTTSFIGFVASYFGPYRHDAAGPFFASFGQAIRYAATQTQGEICITDRVNMPYIFVLFYNREDPRLFKQTVRFTNPGAEFQTVSSFGRYRFGLDGCAQTAPVIVATPDEAGPLRGTSFTARDFERYTVLRR